MSHRKRDAGDEMLGRTDSRWMDRKPFRSLAISPDLSSVQDEFEVDAKRKMSGWTDGSSGEGAGADDGYGFDDGGGAGQTARILNLTLTDRRTAPGVSEGAVTMPWVERRVWEHETSRSRQTDRASSGGIE